MFFVIALLGATGGFAFTWLAYKIIRPVFPARVNCWFCQKWMTVPYPFRNSWDCSACQQYNGFDQDGGYNKIIPGQHGVDFHMSRQYSAISRDTFPLESKLCNKCSRNQILKVKQLASFVPFDENSYDDEVECYRHHLEQVYRLCRVCSAVTEQELHKQDQIILARLSPDLRERCQEIVPPLQALKVDGRGLRIITLSKLFTVLSWICCLILMVSYLPSCLESDADIKGDNLKRILSLVCFISNTFVDRTVVVFLGLFLEISSKLIIGKFRIYLIDGLSSLSWLILTYANLLQDAIHLSNLTSLSLCVITVVMVTLSLLQNREPRNRTTITMRRLSLGNTSMEEDTSFADSSTRLSDHTLAYPNKSPAKSGPHPAPWDNVTSNIQASSDSVYHDTSSTQLIQRRPEKERFYRPFSGSLSSVPDNSCHQNTTRLERDSIHQPFVGAQSGAPAFSNCQRPQLFSANVVDTHPGSLPGHTTDSMFRVIHKSANVERSGSSVCGEVSSVTTTYPERILPDQLEKDLDLELSGISLGGSALKRSKSLYSSLPTFRDVPSTLNPSSHLMSSCHQRRPLISPAKLNTTQIGVPRHRGFQSSWREHSFSKPFSVLSDSPDVLTSLPVLTTCSRSGWWSLPKPSHYDPITSGIGGSVWESQHRQGSVWDSQQKEGSVWDSQQKEGSVWGSQQKEGSVWGSQQKEGSVWGSQQKEGSVWDSQQKEGSVWGSQQKEGSVWGSPQKQSSVWGSQKKEGSVWGSQQKEGSVWGSQHRQGSAWDSQHKEGSVWDSQQKEGSVWDSQQKQSSVWDSQHKQLTNTGEEERCQVDSTTSPTPLLNQPETTPSVSLGAASWWFYVLIGGLALSVLVNLILVVTRGTS